ncbi:MAG: hypothetical protein GWN55_12360 [Phycisphaerae bacterium]|nr:hypothetical protein [Phycisphaerae bacterium]NIR51532.1 hypothetical protein [candidate division KSB1 bacterium]NIS26928.1 hypothetical protein [candidate division KSB1 bacterium]NIT73768.1 hypothetical protein [candidate division KSB1 bacterium]NIU27674.1 hypothetical protein [candidate division KSB1 bacterium]
MKDRKHNTYSLDFKRQAVMLASHPDIKAKDVTDALAILPFMLSMSIPSIYPLSITFSVVTEAFAQREAKGVF